jgi:hypothetical protein
MRSSFEDLDARISKDFPGISWHHSASLVACGASCLPFVKISLFLEFSTKEPREVGENSVVELTEAINMTSPQF